MKITVRAEDIVLGKLGSSISCPIARAANRASGKQCEAGYSIIVIGGQGYRLPREASNFIFDFDTGGTPQPFEFEVADLYPYSV